MSLTAIARVVFSGVHAWASQPDGALRPYLKSPHRHLFHVEVGVPVSHGDRAIEILELGTNVLNVIEDLGTVPNGRDINLGARSCEHLAEYIAANLPIGPIYVRVFEDGENGAEWRP